jgi:hypothetical protein
MESLYDGHRGGEKSGRTLERRKDQRVTPGHEGRTVIGFRVASALGGPGLAAAQFGQAVDGFDGAGSSGRRIVH